MDLAKEIDVRLRARYTLLHIVSLEEERVLKQVEKLCGRTQRALYYWDHADYFKKAVGDGADLSSAKDPLSALTAIERAGGECVFVLRDFHQCWKNQPRIIRKLRNVAQALKYTRKTIIVTAPTAEIPEELKDDAVVLEVPPPGFKDLLNLLEQLAKTPGARMDLDDDRQKPRYQSRTWASRKHRRAGSFPRRSSRGACSTPPTSI